MKPLYLIQDVKNLEEKVLHAVYGPDWRTLAARNEKRLKIDIINRINSLESQLRAHRSDADALR